MMQNMQKATNNQKNPMLGLFDQKPTKQQKNPMQGLFNQKPMQGLFNQKPAKQQPIVPLFYQPPRQTNSKKKHLLPQFPTNGLSIFGGAAPGKRYKKMPTVSKLLSDPTARFPWFGDRDRDGVMNMIDCHPRDPKRQHPFQSDEQRKAVMAAIQKQQETVFDQDILFMKMTDSYNPRTKTTMNAYERMKGSMELGRKRKNLRPLKEGSFEFKKQIYIENVMGQKRGMDPSLGKRVEDRTIENAQKRLDKLKRPTEEKIKRIYDEEEEKAQARLADKMTKSIQDDMEKDIKERILIMGESEGYLKKIPRETLNTLQQKHVKRGIPLDPMEQERYRAMVKMGSGYDTDTASPLSKDEIDYWKEEIPYKDVVIAEHKVSGLWRVGEPNSKFEYKRIVSVPEDDTESTISDMVSLKHDPRVKIKL